MSKHKIPISNIAVLELVKYTSVRISSEFGVRNSENFVPHLFEKGYNLLPSLNTLYSNSFLTVYPDHEIGLRKAVNQPIPVRYFDKKQKRYNWCNSRDDGISEGNRVETPVLY